VDDSTDVELIAARFRALGDTTRLLVIDALAEGPLCVCDLRDHIHVAGPLLSHHLRVLRDAGIVTAARRGRWVDYTLEPETLTELAEHLAPAMAGASR
jgi:ArsR family transcriptional regulator